MEAETELGWEVHLHGGKCHKCGRFRTNGKVVKQYPDGRPHPRPYRRFKCPCGNRWKATIPLSQLVRREDVRNQCEDTRNYPSETQSPA